MTLERLNKILKPKFMVAEIEHRPGYGLTSIAGEYEIWVSKYPDQKAFDLKHDWISHSKDGKGLTLEQALTDACRTLKIEDK